MSLEQRVADEVARAMARSRFGPGVEMGGAHNPRPSETREAQRIVAEAFAELRESIARDLEADLLPGPGEKGYGLGNGVHNEALTLAAHIARNGAST